MKKILLVILSTLLLVVATNTEAKASKGLGMWKEYGKHDFQDFSQFMLDASEGKDLTKYKDWFNCTPKKAYEYSSKYIAFKFPGWSLEQVIAGTEFAQITKEDLEEGTLSYLDTSRQNYMGLLWAKRKDAEILSPKERLGSFEGLGWWDEWCGNLYNGPAPEPREEIVFTPPTKKKSDFSFGGFTQAGPNTNLSYNYNQSSAKVENSGNSELKLTQYFYGVSTTPPAAAAQNNNTYVEPANTYVDNNNYGNQRRQAPPPDDYYYVDNQPTWLNRTTSTAVGTLFGTFSANALDHWIWPEKAPQNNTYIIRRNGNGNGGVNNNPHRDYSTGLGDAGEYIPRNVPPGRDNPNQNHPTRHPR